MRYFITIVVGLLLAAGIYTGLFLASLGRTDSNSAASIAGWYHHKDQIAEALPTPRIVVISGSNTLYGVRARRIEEATGIPTVNFGTHAALSRDYLLNRPKRILRAGDTVILALEYELYFPNQVNEVQSDYVLGADAEYFFGMPLKDQLFWAASASFPKIWDRVSASKKRRNKLETKSLARIAEQLNDRGDFIANAREKQTPGAKQIVEQLKPLGTLLQEDWAKSAGAWTDLRNFAAWCRDHGISVFATFPNTIHFKEYDGEKVAAVSDYLLQHYADLGIPTLGDPKACMFPADDFFDTVYHLNQDGAVKRTDQLLGYLQPHLDRIRNSRGEEHKQ